MKKNKRYLSLLLLLSACAGNDLSQLSGKLGQFGSAVPSSSPSASASASVADANQVSAPTSSRPIASPPKPVLPGSSVGPTVMNSAIPGTSQGTTPGMTSLVGTTSPGTTPTPKPAVNSNAFDQYTIDAPGISDHYAYSNLVSAMAADRSVHIAWLVGTSQIKYAVYRDGSAQVFTVDASANCSKYDLSIAVDKNGHPHLTYEIKFNKELYPYNGYPYAVRYAGDPDGDGQFTIEAVSKDPSGATAKFSNYDPEEAYVSSIPRIYSERDEVSISYLGHGNSKIDPAFPGGDKSIVLARKNLSGGTWQRTQAFVPKIPHTVKNDVWSPHATAGDGSFIQTNPLLMGDIASYSSGKSGSKHYPILFRYSSSRWQKQLILIPGAEYSENLLMGVGQQGTVYVNWFDDLPSGTDRFFHSKFVNGATTPLTISLDLPKRGGGVYAGVAFDFVTDKTCFLYQTTFPEKSDFIYFIDENHQISRAPFTQRKGSPDGQQAMNYRNNYLSLVTSDGGKIYVYTKDTNFLQTQPVEQFQQVLKYTESPF